MANTKSSKIDIRKSRKSEIANRKVRSTLKTLSKKAHQAVESNDESATKVCSSYIAVLDKAAKRNIIHKNKASRLKSKTAKLLNSAS